MVVSACLLVWLAAACTDGAGQSVRATITSSSGPTFARDTADPIPSGSTNTPLFYRYEVRVGDTVDSIAIQFGIAPEYVRWNNDLSLVGAEPKPFVVLDIPPGNGMLHRVTPDELLSDVASKYGVAAKDVIDYPGNGLRAEASILTPGQMLFVPRGRPTH